jgi:monomeric isocitrate dehydrogenase
MADCFFSNERVLSLKQAKEMNIDFIYENGNSIAIGKWKQKK